MKPLYLVVGMSAATAGMVWAANTQRASSAAAATHSSVSTESTSHSQSKPPEVIQVLPAPPPASLLARSRTAGCNFPIATRLSYEIDLASEAEVDPRKLGFTEPGAASGGPPTATAADPVHLARKSHVTLDLQARSTDEERGATFVARYREIHGDGVDAAPDLDAPFLVRIDPRCTLTGFARLDSIVASHARAQQAIAYELMWRWPHDKTETFPGENTFGHFQASYVLADDPGGPIVQRRISSYPGVGRGIVPTLSLTTVRLGPASWFESLASDESVDANGAATSGTHTQTSAKRVPTPDNAFNGIPLDLSRYVWDDLLRWPAQMDSTLATAGRPPTRRELAERAAAMKLTVKEATNAYVSRVKAGENVAQTWPPLAAFLEARPEATKDVVAAMKHGAIPQDALPGAFVALGGARTPEARNALLGIVSDAKAPPIDRTRGMLALATRPDVGPSFAASLRANVGGISQGASRSDRFLAKESALALGLMAGAHGDPAVVSIASQAASQILARGKTAATLSPGFDTIANIGDPSLLSSVTSFTQSPDSHVREAAAIVVRRMRPSDTESFTVTWLVAETNPNVKRAIYATVESQTHDAQTPAGSTLIAQAIRDLQAKPDVLTRRSIIRILGGAVKVSPDARQTLIHQVRFEQMQQSDLYGVIAGFLSGPDIQEALQR